MKSSSRWIWWRPIAWRKLLPTLLPVPHHSVAFHFRYKHENYDWLLNVLLILHACGLPSAYPPENSPSGRRWWNRIVTWTGLSLFGTFALQPFLGNSTRTLDFSSNDFTSALVCRSSQLAHSPCHSSTTSLLEACAVKANWPPTVNDC